MKMSNEYEKGRKQVCQISVMNKEFLQNIIPNRRAALFNITFSSSLVMAVNPLLNRMVIMIAVFPPREYSIPPPMVNERSNGFIFVTLTSCPAGGGGNSNLADD